jgi:O-antigen/teichoic acid export membrane protein
MSLKSDILSASKWSISTEVVKKAITPVVFLILARILPPADFGLVAVPTIIISFSQIFWDAGLSKALIQQQDHLEESATVVFWTNAFLGIIVYFIFYWCAGFIAEWFEDPRVKLLIKIQGFQIIITSLGSVQTALFQRSLNFKPLFKIRLLTTAAPAILSIPLALTGMRYWALVAGTLAGSFMQLLLLWKLSNWRPALSYNMHQMKRMLSFSFWVSLESLLAWFYLWIDSVIVGAYLTSEDLGFYRTGDLLVTSVFGVCIAPLVPVLYSGFSKLQSQKHKLDQALANSTIIIGMISIPLGTGLFLTRNLLESVVFSSQWSGIASVIGVFGLLYGLTWINGPQIEAFRAIGRPDINTKLMVIGMLYSIPLFLYFIRFGLGMFVWVRLLTICPTFTIRLVLSKRFFHISWIACLKRLKLFFAIVAMVCLIIPIVEASLNSYTIASFRLIVIALVSSLIYALFILIQKKQLKALLNI